MTTALLWPEKVHIAQRQQNKRETTGTTGTTEAEIDNNDIFKAQ